MLVFLSLEIEYALLGQLKVEHGALQEVLGFGDLAQIQKRGCHLGHAHESVTGAFFFVDEAAKFLGVDGGRVHLVGYLVNELADAAGECLWKIGIREN